MHPVWMVLTLAMAGLALRAGLAMRSARQRGLRPDPGLLRRHLRLAKPTLVMVGIGFVAGPISMALWRGRPPFETAHALLASGAALLFFATGLLGRRLERGRRGVRDLHALLGLLSVGIGAAAAVAGFVLLP